jgi:hypothetical protein
MARSRRNKRSSRRGKRSRGVVDPQYRGPIRLPSLSGLDARTMKANLSYSSIVTSTASGTLASFITGENAATATDWPSYALLYAECRVLGIRVDYTPYYNGSYSATVLQSAGVS